MIEFSSFLHQHIRFFSLFDRSLQFSPQLTEVGLVVDANVTVVKVGGRLVLCDG
jgi:hypothetical protein